MKADIGDPVLCTYCLKAMSSTEVTDDHVIARSWFPADTPSVAKWVVPARNNCNNRYSAIEQNILGRLALSLDPNDQSVGEIVQKARRSIDPTRAKSPRDWMHRFNKREALGRDVTPIHDPRARGVLSSFRKSFESGSRTGIAIPAQDLRELVKKWIRGVLFREIGHLVPADYEVSVQFVDDDVAAQAFSGILEYVRRVQKGPGFEVLIWHAEDQDTWITQYAFTIWREFRACGSIERHIAR